MEFIPEEIYSQICQNMPVLCVDALLESNEKYLLLKRKEDPLKNEYWLPGGRVLHKEKLQDAIIRIIKRETNINLHVLKHELKFLGITEMIFSGSRLTNSKYHTPAIIFKINLEIQPKISLDNTSSDFIWSKTIPEILKKNLKLF